MTSFRQVIIIISQEYVCEHAVPVLEKMSCTFHDISFGMGEMYITSLMLLPGTKGSYNGLPQEQNILSTGIWFMFHSVLRILSLCDMILCVGVGEDGELV